MDWTRFIVDFMSRGNASYGNVRQVASCQGYSMHVGNGVHCFLIEHEKVMVEEIDFLLSIRRLGVRAPSTSLIN